MRDGRRAPRRGRCGACSSTPSRSAPSTGAGCSPNFRDLTPSTPRRRRPRGRGADRAAPAPHAAPAGGAAAARRLRLEVAARPPLRPRARLRRPLRRRRATPSGSTAASVDDALALLVHGRRRRPAERGGHLRRRRRRGAASSAARRPRSTRESIFDYLEPRAAPAAATSPTTCRSTSTAASSATSATSSRPTARATLPHRSSMPDAAFIFADRLIAFDHLEQSHLRALPAPTPTSEAEGRALDRRDEPRALDVAAAARAALDLDPADGADAPVEFRLSRVARAVPRRHRRAARTT